MAVDTASEQHQAVNEVIKYIQQHLHDPLPLARLAKHVAYSPYHFTRIFKQRTGLSPLYYVASLRLQKAKELLLNTNLSIRDIALEIGQQSLGTFTTRFAERVGVSPARYRQSAPRADDHLRSLQEFNHWLARSAHSVASGATVAGTIRTYTEVPFEGVVLLGLFPKPIPEGFPLYGTLLPALGTFSLTNVKPGIYYLMATSVAWGTASTNILLPYTTLRTRSRAPIIVKPFTEVPHQDVTLYPPRFDDPPILISLPLLMKRFLDRMGRNSNW